MIDDRTEIVKMELTLYARMDGTTNVTCDFFNFTIDDPLMKVQMCDSLPDVAVRPRPEALRMAETLRAGCADKSVGPMSCIFFPAQCTGSGYLTNECTKSKLNATTSNRSYEPLVRDPGSVHLELIGPDLNDRNKLKLFLTFLADNAGVISQGMRGSSLSFYGT